MNERPSSPRALTEFLLSDYKRALEVTIRRRIDQNWQPPRRFGGVWSMPVRDRINAGASLSASPNWRFRCRGAGIPRAP
jgi:hypothetical protein